MIRDPEDMGTGCSIALLALIIMASTLGAG